ncbi:MAG: YceI family protein [Bacteroidetes bacterium]|nr:YceI family protein [Bacteroidota bacterium]
MKNLIKIAVILFALSNNVFAQKYISKTGKVSFYSEATMEKIEAHNNQMNAAINLTTSDVVFKVLIKSFEFEKALMQEHFNENYLESDKFPNATYIGKITNESDIIYTKDGTYKAITEGNLTIHGVTKKITETGTIQVKDGKIIIVAKFNILLKDYNIKIPKNVANNISETVQISVNVTLDKVN